MGFVRERLVYYGKNTNLHGLGYVADQNRHPLIRLFWMLVFLLSFCGMTIIFMGSYSSFQNNAISFVTETTYLDWSTTFPAISICEITGSEIELSTASVEERSLVQQFIGDLIFFTGSCYTCNHNCKSCETIDFGLMVKLFRKPCEKLMKTCKWNDYVFDCCDEFLPLETEYGTCFSLNSLHTQKTKAALNMESNRKTGPGQLVIETIDDVRLYIHPEEDVPFINSDPDLRKDVMLGETYNITFSVTEIENDENVKYLPVEKRGCRFPWEVPDGLRVHTYYSYSTCVVQCHADYHIKLCNCTHHLMPVYNKESYCNIQGLQCLTDKFETVNRLHAKGSEKPGLTCECVPSCVEPEYKIVEDSKGVQAVNSEIVIQMAALPTSRFKRTVVRTTLDLVVSVGGTAGLFTGASLLSIIETPYLLLHRRNAQNAQATR